MHNEIKSSPLRIGENLAQVMALLDEFHHEELLRAAGDPGEPKPRVHNTLPDLRDRLSRMHSADVALVLESLPADDRLLAWRQISHQRGGEILVVVTRGVRAELISRLDEEEMRLAIGQLDADALLSIAAALPAELLQERLLALPDTERAWLQSALGHAEGTVGHVMSNRMVAVREHHTLAEVLSYLHDLSGLPRHTDKIFVIDSDGMLRGVVAVQTLLLTTPETPLREVMATDVVAFTPGERGRDAAQAFERYHLLSAPVVTPQGKLLGRITIDAVLEQHRATSGGQLLNFAGLRGEEGLYSSIWNSARNRWPWLAINLLAAFVASRVVGLFEANIAQLVALAVLMPIVAGIGGTTGSQTSTLAIRALAAGPVSLTSLLHLLGRELRVTLLNGAILALIVSLFAYLLFHAPHLSLIVAVALILNLLMAALIGIAVPLLLQSSGRDPALGSGVLLTAAADGMGFFIFLALARAFLF